MNPDVVDAFALAIITMPGPPAFPGFPEPDLVRAGAIRSRIQAAMAALRVAAPETGAYVNAITSSRIGKRRFGGRTTSGSFKSSAASTPMAYF